MFQYNGRQDDSRMSRLVSQGNAQTTRPGDIQGQIAQALQAQGLRPEQFGQMTWPQIIQALTQKAGPGSAQQYQGQAQLPNVSADIIKVIQQAAGSGVQPSQFLGLPQGGTARLASSGISGMSGTQ